MTILNSSTVDRIALATVATLLIALPLGSGLAVADEDDRRLDHEQVYEAVQDGRIKPLAAILEIVARDFGEPVIEVEFEVKQGEWVYEIVTLGAGGRITERYFDAATARLIKTKKNGKTDRAR